MVHRLSKSIVQSMFKNGYTKEDDIEVAIYGMQLILSTLLIISSISLLSIVSSKFVEAFIFCFVFANLRTFAGGWHARSYIGCYFTSVITCLGVIHVVSYLGMIPNSVFIVLMVIGNLLVLLLAPVETPTKPLNAEEREIYKRKSRKALVTCDLIIIVLLVSSYNSLFVVGVISLLIESLTLISVKRGETQK